MADQQLGTANYYTYAQIKQLWIANGGDPKWAPLMAGVALVESGNGGPGNAGVLNNTPGTSDYSVGLWQINYFGPLLAGRTQEFGSPQALANDPNAQAKAAIALLGNGSGITNWQNDSVAGPYIASQSSSGRAPSPWSDTQVQGVLKTGGTPVTISASTSGTTPGTSVYNGGGGWVIQLDSALNPKSSGGLWQITGVPQAETAIEQIAVRGLFALGFVGVITLGIIMIGGKTGSKLVGKPFGLGMSTAEKVSNLATTRNVASEAAKEQGRRARQAEIARRESARESAITQRQREAHAQTLERDRQREASRLKVTAAVGRRSKARIAEEESKARHTEAQKRLVNARTRNVKARKA